MNENTSPAWIEAAPEPKRTEERVVAEEVLRSFAMGTACDIRDKWTAPYGGMTVQGFVEAARAANHRILKLRRQLRDMRGEQ